MSIKLNSVSTFIDNERGCTLTSLNHVNGMLVMVQCTEYPKMGQVSFYNNSGEWLAHTLGTYISMYLKKGLSIEESFLKANHRLLYEAHKLNMLQRNIDAFKYTFACIYCKADDVKIAYVGKPLVVINNGSTTRPLCFESDTVPLVNNFKNLIRYETVCSTECDLFLLPTYGSRVFTEYRMMSMNSMFHDLRTNPQDLALQVMKHEKICTEPKDRVGVTAFIARAVKPQ